MVIGPSRRCRFDSQSRVLLIAFLAAPAGAVKIADITRIGGERTNILTGLGLVYGLKGTGDGGGFTPAIAPCGPCFPSSATPPLFWNSITPPTSPWSWSPPPVPAAGARDGDHLDVHISSIGAAASLHGGRLFVTPMQGPLPGGPLLALAEGPVTIEDPSTPTVGVIRAAAGGAVMEADLPARVIDAGGRFTLILDEYSSSWGTASRIAKIINDSEGADGETLATAIDGKNVVVTMPASEREHPDSFISRIQQLPVQMLATRRGSPSTRKPARSS